MQMLAAGGSAADAAVAAAAGMQATMPCQTGLGGDVFVLYYEAASGTVFALAQLAGNVTAATVNPRPTERCVW